MKYAAHVILGVRFRDGEQSSFPCYENVLLIDAETDDDALAEAERLGQMEAADDDSFRWDDRPARWEFVGVRKLIECRTPGGDDTKAINGTELTYSHFTLASEGDLRRFADGEAVTVRYEE